MTTVERLEAEMRVARAAVEALLADGWLVSVSDGEETTVFRSADADAICAALGTTDEDTLHCWKPGGEEVDGFRRQIASVWLVYGNEPWEVIADHSDILGDVLKPVTALADEIEASCTF